MRFAKARAPVAIAMRVVAASVAQHARAIDAAPAVRRSVFVRRATLGLAAPFPFEGLAGTTRDKDPH